MKWRTIAVSVALTTTCLVALWRVVEPIYLELDDAAIRLTLAGEDLPGEPPTSHLVFTHEALARAAVAVQRSIPSLPVWDLVLTAGLLAGIACLAALAWSVPGGAMARAAALGLTLAAVAPFATGLRFTISAVICSGAGVLVAVRELFSEQQRRRSMFAMAAILIVWGYLIRPMAAEGGVLVILACLVPVAAARAPRRARLIQLAVMGVVLIASGVLLDAVDRALYTEQGGWANYYTATWQFVNLIDWNGAARDLRLDAVRAAAGWSENDWKMLWLGWGITDHALFGPERIASAYSVLRAGSTVLERAQAALHAWSVQSATNLLETFSIVTPFAVVLAIGAGTRRAVALTACILIEFVVICVVLDAGFKQLPFRLLAPLQACIVGVMILGVSEHLQPARRRLAGAVALTIAFALFAQQLWSSMTQARAEMNYARGIEAQMSEVLKLNPSFVVLHGDAFPSGHWWRPFHRPAVRFPMIRLGGNNGNPLLQDFLARTGRTRLLVSICADPTILVVADRARLDLVTQYMSEHAGRTVTWEPAFEGSFSAWRCR